MPDHRSPHDELQARLADAERAVEALRVREAEVAADSGEFAQVEDALGEVTRRLREVLESVCDAFVAVDRQWRIHWANERAALMADRDLGHLVGRDLWESLPALREGGAHDLCRAVLEDATPRSADVQLADGRWLALSAYPSAEGLSIYWREVTESKLTQQRRDRQRELMQKLIDNASVGIAVIGRDHRYLMANRAYRHIPGREDKPIVGQTIHEVLTESGAARALRMLESVFSRGRRVGITEFELIPSPGASPSYYDVDYIPLFAADGTVGSALALVYNVTAVVAARQRVEELARETERNLSQLQAVLDSTDEGLVILDLDGRVVMANPATAAIFPNQEHLVSHHAAPDMAQFFEVTTLSGEPFGVNEGLTERVLRGERFANLELRVRPLPDGDERICAFGGAPVYDRGELILGIITLRDITEQVHTREQLRRLNEELEQQVEERTRLAEKRAALLQEMAAELLEAEQRERRRMSTVLHDRLQQTLAAGKVRAQSLAGQAQPGAARSTLSELIQLLTEAMEVSRSLAAELSPPVLAHGLPAALDWLREQMLARHGLVVQLAIEEEAEPAAEEISAYLLQAAQELLFNVVKHAGVRAASVHLSRDDQQVVLEVSDQGRGFDPERLGPVDGARVAGSGLLNIRRRLELLGGGLQIRTGPGEGTTFRLHAPLGRPAAPATRRRPVEHLPSPRDHSAGSGRKLRVLVVDDHDIVRGGLVGLLADYPDLDVVGEAGDGTTAIAMADKLQPDVILMDVSMPGMSGIEATRRIVSKRPATRVVGLSMHEGKHVAHQMHEAGAAAYVTKDAPCEELIMAIRGGEVGSSD